MRRRHGCMPPRAKFDASRFVRAAIAEEEIRLNREPNPTPLFASQRLAAASSLICLTLRTLRLGDVRDDAKFARRAASRLPFVYPHLPCSPTSSRIRLAP